MTNRITEGIKKIEERLKEVTKEKQDALDKSLSEVTLHELIEYQNTQAISHACGIITTEEAQTLYNLFGGEIPSPEKFKKLSLAEKIIATQTAAELLQKRCNIV